MNPKRMTLKEFTRYIEDSVIPLADQWPKGVEVVVKGSKLCVRKKKGLKK